MSRIPLAAALSVGLLSFAAPAHAGPAACDGPAAGTIHSAEQAAGSTPVAGAAAAGAIHRAEDAAC